MQSKFSFFPLVQFFRGDRKGIPAEQEADRRWTKTRELGSLNSSAMRADRQGLDFRLGQLLQNLLVR